MLFNMNWLQNGKTFPPQKEEPRITRYRQNAALFDGDHFDDPSFRVFGHPCCQPIDVYMKCASRISQVVGNFDDVVSFPTLLNYQRLMSLKMADLVCGEYPTVSGVTSQENEAIQDVRDVSDFDAKLYATVIDISRYGDAIWRIYKDYDGRYNFTCWDPTQWYPIVSQDGTYSIKAHCLCWIENVSPDDTQPVYELNVQIHSTDPKEVGHYTHEVYSMSTSGTTIGPKKSSERVATGLDRCAVFHLRAFQVTNSVYGYDDYMPIDSILAEIMARLGQISGILDKHADPNITGPISMLEQDPDTGEYHLRTGKFFAVTDGEQHPEYMTWDGQLTSAFKQLEFLINQLYILSEMGAALLGGQEGSAQAISGTAMRFKMVNPLAKARRIANSLTRSVRQLFSVLSVSAEVDESKSESDEKLELPIPYRKISVFWADGLPDDPSENIENCKLATGATTMMPLEKGIMEFFGRSNEEAKAWVEQINREAEEKQARQFTLQVAQAAGADPDDPNKPGPQDGTGVNPQKKKSETGLTNPHSSTNGGIES